jgi:hypothetical protein
MSGTRARPPTLMKMRGAVRTSSPTRIFCGPSKRAWPWTSVIPSIPCNHLSSPARAFSVTPRARAITFGKSTRTSDATTPRSVLRARCAAYALETSALVGMQPVLTQVPPRNLRSTSATFIPAPVNREPSEGPAWPAPRMIAS